MKDIPIWVYIVGLLLCIFLIGRIEYKGEGNLSLEKIDTGLFYDTETNIVYYWNGMITSPAATTPTVRYAPNGLPYKYDAEKKEFYEITEDENNRETISQKED